MYALCVYVYICMYVCVYIYIYIYIYMCVCVCVCVYTYVRTLAISNFPPITYIHHGAVQTICPISHNTAHKSHRCINTTSPLHCHQPTQTQPQLHAHTHTLNNPCVLQSSVGLNCECSCVYGYSCIFLFCLPETHQSQCPALPPPPSAPPFRVLDIIPLLQTAAY